MRAEKQADRLTLLAFAGTIAAGGSNAVAVRFSNRELAPFWGSGLRFGVAAAIFFAIVLLRRLPLPRGRALLGVTLYGVLGFGAANALIYYGLVRVSAGLGQVILGLVPLLTLFLAVGHGQEPFRWHGLAGGLLAVAGLGVASGGQLGGSVPAPSLIALIVGAACIAETGIVIKGFPRANPVSTNAVAMAIGAAIVLMLSIFFRESRVIPMREATWLAVGYLVLVGSLVLFMLFLYVLKHWTASAAAYQFVLYPLVAVTVGAWLAHEPITWRLAVGGAIVLVGVYVGALAPRRAFR